ncbi:hypothetical protein SAMN05660330_00668 [Desulforhopalus singaporensis]|uniref:Uncharacterized protein n=2 Tax=Desulforhopalus singaporensis TaxID=91360 RepID=A0A1H0L561_9BACT|nr:hypothetical protein SAMN05660330_00668 [Desulforhopalus singaporensis]
MASTWIELLLLEMISGVGTGAKLTATPSYAIRRTQLRYGMVSMRVDNIVGAVGFFENCKWKQQPDIQEATRWLIQC